jgi:hypothetical protein
LIGNNQLYKSIDVVTFSSLWSINQSIEFPKFHYSSEDCKSKDYMAEIIIIEILLSLGVVSFVSYLIFTGLRKNQRFNRANEQGRDMILIEKELDRTDAVKRGLHMLNKEKRQATNRDSTLNFFQ